MVPDISKAKFISSVLPLLILKSLSRARESVQSPGNALATSQILLSLISSHFCLDIEVKSYRFDLSMTRSSLFFRFVFLMVGLYLCSTLLLLIPLAQGQGHGNGDGVPPKVNHTLQTPFLSVLFQGRFSFG